MISTFCFSPFSRLCFFSFLRFLCSRSRSLSLCLCFFAFGSSSSPLCAVASVSCVERRRLLPALPAPAPAPPPASISSSKLIVSANIIYSRLRSSKLGGSTLLARRFLGGRLLLPAVVPKP
uniref:Putative secreted protein n=1 Tax=Anopheles darlingi TaxID=43151 RepID=A0A2M4DM01_ANODA